MNTLTLKIVEIQKETEETITLCFKQPALRKVRYKAGQYLTLIFRIDGRRYLRPYSFSSALETDSTLNVTVKRVVNGIVSNYIHDYLKEGDTIEALQPMGEFVFNDDQKDIENLYLWGAGSGVTPLMSLAKSCLLNYPNMRVHLIYGNKSFETTIFHDAIIKLQDNFPNRFITYHFHTSPKEVHESNGVFHGRIEANKILALLSKKRTQRTAHYICGPDGLKAEVKLALNKLGISKSNIFSEDFELKKDPEDFKDIEDRQVKIEFEKEAHHIEILKMESVLDAALNKGLELPYSCQTGSCSTCKAKLLTGKLTMIGLESEREDLAEDEYLLCCSYPLSDDVLVRIND
ncbi:MAG: ring-1,2-phenylacetyl-CoA epoxidase subunit PaaE [Parvicella sp.]|jgi:ring-1,2-phenylacetyl-CoA epoxidase subunit PaaE